MMPTSINAPKSFTNSRSKAITNEHAVIGARVQAEALGLRGLARWPDIDRTFADLGEFILREDFEAGLAAGAVLGQDGRLTFGFPSAAGQAAVVAAAKANTGFVWTDDGGRRWALRVSADQNRSEAWHANGLSCARDCCLLDPDYRQRVRGRLHRQLRPFLERNDLPPRDLRIRAGLHQRTHQLQLLGQGLALLPRLQCRASEFSAIVEADLAELAAELWGSNVASWPKNYLPELVASIAALGDVRYAQFALPKGGWAPRMLAQTSALLSLQVLDSDLLRIHLSSSFLTWLPHFTVGSIDAFDS